MPAAKYDFEIEQGASFALAFVYKDSSGGPVNLTGYTARMQIRASVSASGVLLDLNTDNGRLVLSHAAGRVAIELDPATTAAFAWRKGVYDLELVSPSGGVVRLVEGQITVSREVTRNGA